jgi:hypothetical protein
MPVYQYRKTLGNSLDRAIRRYCVRRKLEYSEINWKVNQHMGSPSERRPPSTR